MAKADTTSSSSTSPSPRPKRRWLRWLGIATAALVALLLVAYFVVTSSGFLKGVILPRVGASLNSSITVSDASIHPFSGVVLRDFKLQPNGRETLVTASEVRASYHLWDILHGNIRVDEIALVSPTIELVQSPDGTSNLDPLTKSSQSKPAEEKKPVAEKKSSTPPQIDIGKITLSNADLRQIKNYEGGRRDVMEVTNFNLTLSNLKNGQQAKLEIAADVRADKNPPTGSSGSLAAALKGEIDCALSADLKPASVTGGINFNVSQAQGAFANFNALGAVLDCNVTPTEIKQVAVRFQQSGATLGELDVTGPFDSEKMEGKLDLELRGIDRRLLNLAGSSSGIDFNGTAIGAGAQIQLANAGAQITVTGKVNADKFQVTRAGQTTPTLNLSAGYDVTIDRSAQSATLRKLDLAGTQNNNQLLSANLTSPMTFAWGGNAANVGDAVLNLDLTGLNLADWRPFLGNSLSAGTVAAKLNLTSREGGKQVVVDLTTDITGLAARVGSNEISQATVHLAAQAEAAQMKMITLSNVTASINLQNQQALRSSASGTYDLGSGDANLQVKSWLALAPLTGALPQSSLNVSGGNVELNATVAQKQKNQQITGQATLEQFTGRMGKDQFQNWNSRFDFDLANSPDQVQIHKLAVSFSPNVNAAPNIEVSGTYQTVQKSADLTVKLADVNESALRPFLEPLLGGKQLQTVTISGNLSTQYQPQGASSVKGNVQVSKLVVKEPANKMPATPLEAGLQLDASLDKQAATVRQFTIGLTPTDRATNQLQFTGHMDLSHSDAMQGDFKLAADSLDLTRYYDLFAGGTNAVAKKVGAPPATPATAAPGAPAASANQEPAPVHLPFKDFTLAANIGALYLHEVAITNFQTTLKIDGSHVVLKPLQLTLNGAPVDASADLDLSMPGYKYIIAYNAQAIPVAPLVNTFEPARAGQMGGTLTSSAQINGAGITGASLQKNLAGQFDLNLTNLNLAVENVQSPVYRVLINVVAGIPEFIGTVSSGDVLGAAAGLLGSATGQGSLMGELKASPIQFISVQAVAANGQVNLKSAVVQSSAFQASATGGVRLNEVLTNSTINIPVNISLSQSIAQRLKLTSSATSSNSAYAPLPAFFSETGTIGQPKPNINKVALAGAAVRSLGNSILNPTGTNSSPVKDLLNQFLPRGK